jgi:DNA repair protein SbcC/Rad50
MGRSNDHAKLNCPSAKVASLRQSYQSRLVFFKYIYRPLRAQQAEAIGNFTNQYGPRTSIIEWRPQSVYIFDDIEIKEQATAIIVQNRRGKENQRPVDYFSQSQQQTLLLGCF